MARRMTIEIKGKCDFLSILDLDFRWPTEGDAPFTQSDKCSQNIRISQCRQNRLIMMMVGYKKAADLLVAEVEKDQRNGASLVFPIVFNYRQFLELWLKYLIDTYGDTEGVAAEWSTHDIKELWERFRKILDSYELYNDDTDGVVEKILLDFARVDPKSFSYRYPVDKKGKMVALAQEQIDLQNLADVMNGLEGYFYGCDGYLTNHAVI